MNVHILSDTPRGASAYSKIARNLALKLEERGHNITITGFLNGYENFKGINVLPLATPFTHSQVQFLNNLSSGKAEVLICIHEAHSDYNIYSKLFSPTFFYVPVEGEGIPEHMVSDLSSETIKSIVTMSEIGKKELLKEGIESKVIYPGYDPEIFKKSSEQRCKLSMDTYRQMQSAEKLCERGCFKCSGLKNCEHFEPERILINIAGKEFSGSLASLKSIKENLGAEHVIGCVANNVGLRKRIERLIEAFSRMETKHVLLHLHSLPLALRGINLFRISKKFNVLDRVVFSYGDTVYGISDYGMNTLYNYFDFLATASSYEGFGMPVLEGMASGKPHTAPRCGSFPELLGENEERGLLASIATSSMDADGITRSLVDIESLSEQMDMLCSDKNLRNKLGNAGEEWVKQFTWDNIAEQWDALLLSESVVREHPVCGGVK